MSLAVAGIGWVTPLGSDVSAVWDRLLDGEEAPTEAISTQLNSRAYPVFRIPPDALANIPAHARLLAPREPLIERNPGEHGVRQTGLRRTGLRGQRGDGKSTEQHV